jgi:sporulation integral membrane protein YtvI
MISHRYWIGVGIRSLTVFLILIALYFFLTFTIPLLYPFIIAWIIAMLVEPVILWLQRKSKMPRWAGVTIVLLLLLILLFTLLVFLVAELVIELANLAEMLPSFLNNVTQWFIDTFTEENTDLKRMIDAVQSYLNKNPQHKQGILDSIRQNLGIITNKGTELIANILTGIGNFLGNLPYLLTVLVFIILSTFFIALDWPKIKRKIDKIIPSKIHDTVFMVFSDLRKALFGFMRAQLTLIGISATITLIGLIILDVPYAFTIALLIGLVDLLPYLGVGAVLVPWIIYSFLAGHIQFGMGLSVIYMIILVVRQFLEPKLVASNVGLDPLPTLVSLFVGLKLFGVTGIILGPIILIILQALYRARVFHDVWRYIVGTKGEGAAR